MSREVRIPKAELEAWILQRASELTGVPMDPLECRIYLQTEANGVPLDAIVDYPDPQSNTGSVDARNP